MAATAPSQSDPFGSEFLRRLEQLRLLAKRLAGGTAGVHRSRSIGDGLEFADHRAYAPGDDPRFIDWPYYARMGKLLLRLFHEHSESDVAILLDASASVAAPTGEAWRHELRVAAALAYIGMGSGRRVRLLPFAEQPGPSVRTPRSREGILDVLDFLRGLTPAGETHLPRAARQIAGAGPDCDAVILLSDLHGCEDDLGESLALLRGQGRQVSVLHVHAAGEARPDLSGPLQLHDAETDGELAVDASPALLVAYATQWSARCERLQRDCRRREAIYVSAPSDMPFEQLIFTALRRAGVVA